MAVTAVACPSCGAALENSDAKEFCLCQYCGTKVINDRKNINIPSSGSVRGIAEENSLLDRAFLFIEDGAFLDADKHLERVLDMNPRCSKAYIGKLLCALHLNSINQLCDSNILLTSYDFYNKALRFASPEQAEEYQKLSAAVTENYEQEKKKKENEISAVSESVLSCRQYLSEHKNQYNKAVAKKVLWNILMMLSVLSSIFFAFGTIAVLPFAFIDVPCIVWMILMIRKSKNAKKATAVYNNTKLQLQQDNDLLVKKQNEYKQWLSMQRQ